MYRGWEPCRKDVLAFAYDCCKSNKGAAGVDGQTFEDIEAYGPERWLGELTQELKSRTYQPAAVRRVHIPKPDGKTRPLGIPTVKDRVVQTAAVLVLGAIFGADLPPEQYAYRPDRSALDPVSHVYKLLNTEHEQVVDADLSGYFDSIPHAQLMRCVARRISDGTMLHLTRRHRPPRSGWWWLWLAVKIYCAAGALLLPFAFYALLKRC